MLNKDLWYIIVWVNVKSLQRKKRWQASSTPTGAGTWTRYLLVYYWFFSRYIVFVIEVVPVNYTRVHIRTYVNERILCMTFGINHRGKKAFKEKTASTCTYRYTYWLYNMPKYIYLLIYIVLLGRYLLINIMSYRQKP